MSDNFNTKNGDYKEKIKDMNIKELNDLSLEIRNQIILACSKNGGHLSSNLGVVELSIALFKEFDFPKDKIIFDVGHQSYAYKILTGRSLDNLRKENGISGFSSMQESVYDCYDSGHSSASISAAMGLAIANKEKDANIIALIGDGSISNGLAFEAINTLSSIKEKVIIILNDNDMSISKTTGGLHNFLSKIRSSKKYIRFKEKSQNFLYKHIITRPLFYVLKFFKDLTKKIIYRENIFEMMGLYYISKIDGHDFKSLFKAIEKAKKTDRSIILHVKTKKGKGYDPAENDCSGVFHGVSSFNIETGEQFSSSNTLSWSKFYADLLEKIMEDDNDAYVINPATVVGSCLGNLFEKYPDRTLDVGISEEHAAVLASGLAVGGKHPYLSYYSTFLQRAYDEINHNIARLNLNVTILVDRAGLIGSDGETHQGYFDSSLFINMPNIALAMASNALEATSLMNFSKTYKHPLVIRYPKTNLEKENYNEDSILNIEVGKWITTKEDSSDIALISYGPHIEELKEIKGITLINAIFQNPIDVNLLKTLIDYKDIIIYDPYSIKEGFTANVNMALNELGYKGNIHNHAIPNKYIQTASIENQEKTINLDVEKIINLITAIKEAK